jgi:hypothetical protein
MRYAAGAKRPNCPATTDGNPKIPLPMIELIIKAVRLHRPIVRTKLCEVSATTPSSTATLAVRNSSHLLDRVNAMGLRPKHSQKWLRHNIAENRDSVTQRWTAGCRLAPACGHPRRICDNLTVTEIQGRDSVLRRMAKSLAIRYWR